MKRAKVVSVFAGIVAMSAGLLIEVERIDEDLLGKKEKRNECFQWELACIVYCACANMQSCSSTLCEASCSLGSMIGGDFSCVALGVFSLVFSENVCVFCGFGLVQLGMIYMYIYGYVDISMYLYFMDMFGCSSFF